MDGKMIPIGQPVNALTGETMGAPSPKKFDELNLDVYQMIHNKRGFRLAYLNNFIPDTVKQMCVVEYEFNGIDGIMHHICKWQDCPADEVMLQPRLDLFYDRLNQEDQRLV